MYEGWLELAGVELVNNTRAAAYADSLGIEYVTWDDCQCLHYGLGDREYTYPKADEAPWWDPLVPASDRFAGLLALSIEGLDSAPGGRQATPLAGGGAVLGRLQRPEREMVVTGIALACDEESLSYGMSWLASSLRGSGCGGGCGGDPMCVLAWCPGEHAGQDQWRQALRHLYGAGVTYGPRMIERLPDIGCGGAAMAEVEFGLAAGDPYIYRHEQRVYLPGWTLVATPVIDPPPPCPAAELCDTDPDCDPTTVPLPAAVTQPDPCDCDLVDMPWHTTTLVAPPGATWLQAVPVIEIRTGMQPLECLRIRFWSAPADGNCDMVADGDPCGFCGELGISWVPGGAVLHIDGRTRQATIQCDTLGQPVGPDRSAPMLYSEPGRGFVWPVFDCAGAWCVEFYANVVAVDCQATVALVVREVAT